MKWLHASMLIPLILASTAQSGATDDGGLYEIVDPARDATLTSWGTLGISLPEIDLLLVSIRSSDDEVEVAWVVADLGRRSIRSDESFSYSLKFETKDGASGTLQAVFQASGPSGPRWDFVGYKCFGSQCMWVPASGEAMPNASKVVLRVPPDAFAPAWTEIVAGSIILLPDGSGGARGGGPAWFRDHAPDDGVGLYIPPEA